MTTITRIAPHTADVDKILLYQGVDPAIGLAAREVARRRRQYGPNQLRQNQRKSEIVILVHQFNNIIVWLLATGAAFSIFLGNLAEAMAIFIVLLINGAIGFITELRAARSMEALRRIAQVKTRLRRAGKIKTVNARDLVPGDVVLLEAGDVVTADLRLIQCANLQCDESVLTGESAPVTKNTAVLKANISLGDRINMAFKGCAVTRGQGMGIIVATGMDTQLGRISDLAQSAEAGISPLEKRLDRLGHRLVWLTLGLAAVTILAGVLRGHGLTDMIRTGVALAVAAVPEGLPVVATLTLARGMWRMAARNALISSLSAVETLGATTLILTDKTGTLTENRMTAVRYLLDGVDVDVERGGSRFSRDGAKVDPVEMPPLRQALRIGALCNSATLGLGDQSGADSAGDPMELALLSVAEKIGLGRQGPLEKEREVALHPFDQDQMMMASVHTAQDGFLVAVKGAPEAVIARSTSVLSGEIRKPLNTTGRADWSSRAQGAAAEGLRLLALASRETDRKDADPFNGLTLIGLVCLLDPIRKDVPDAIRAARDAGVRVIMMTGDHAATAATIAKKAGLEDGDITVMEGAEIGDIGDITEGSADHGRILATNVFARVDPETKLDLVTLFQKSGEIVAMTGDGVNDAPALKKADIGIAMGQRGTEVAREAADMVLKDDAFTTIIAAMHQGRIIFENIRTFVIYLMSCNVSEVLVVGLAVGLGLPAPLLPLQILFLNLVTDVFPAFALGFCQGDRDILSRPPRDPGAPIITRGHWTLIGTLGMLITLVTLGAFILALFWLRLGSGSAITVAFLTLALAQLWNVFNMRKTDSGFLVNEVTRNPYVWGALVLCLGLIAAAIWLPGLSHTLHLTNPGTAGLVLALGASFLHYVLGQVVLIFNPVGRLTDPAAKMKDKLNDRRNSR